MLQLSKKSNDHALRITSTKTIISLNNKIQNCRSINFYCLQRQI